MAGAAPQQSTEYNPEDDLAESLNLAYRLIRERMSEGGPGWTPKTEKLETPTKAG